MVAHDSLSAREQFEPGTIIHCTGVMDICDECGQRFRRLSDKKICGRCWPASPLVDSKIPGMLARPLSREV